MKSVPFVSVIVPTYNEERYLRDCLDGLIQQDYPQDRYEIIVVNNSPARYLRLGKAQDRVRLLTEPRRGSYAARNTGVRSAQGEVLAFLDADCVPDPEWLSAGTATLQQQLGIGAVGGTIVFAERETVSRPAYVYQTVHTFDQEQYIQKRQFAAAGNLFTWREVMDRVGLFDDNLLVGGDSQWGRRVHAAGYQLAHAPRAMVHHPMLPSVRALVRRARAKIRGRMRQAEGSDRSNGFPGRASLSDLVSLNYSLAVRMWREPKLRSGSDRGQYGLAVVCIQLGKAYERWRGWFGNR